MSLEAFRSEVRAWLDENCPASCREPVDGSPRRPPPTADLLLWRRRMGERGFTCPTWPREYGGGGLGAAEARVVAEELRRIGAELASSGFGTAMLGPVLLEHGTEEQKREHLPPIARGEIQWCQGYSEPGAGSDLASLQTRAVRDGDEYVVNGQKIWTSGANAADWIFCLVRTDPDAPKHDGISFLLFDLKQPGVTIRPIRLISGASPFCEVFFENARAKARDLIGRENGGWTIAKRLLQHERTMLASGVAAVRDAGSSLPSLARAYLGEVGSQIADPILRDRIAQLEMDRLCLDATRRRSAEAARGAQGPGHAVSVLKLVASEMSKRTSELVISILGAQGLGWEGDAFSPAERAATRDWLRSKSATLVGGTSEVQMNVVAKRVLALPD
jgi:acyl-CoA dehydrogenase